MTCALCEGDLKMGKVNHSVDAEEGIIVIEDVPAKICSQCGEYYIDTQTARRLEQIIDDVSRGQTSKINNQKEVSERLSKEQIEEIREAVGRVDFAQAIQDAKDMGIEITTGERGYHAIYNEKGELEKIDVDKHLVIGKER